MKEKRLLGALPLVVAVTFAGTHPGTFAAAGEGGDAAQQPATGSSLELRIEPLVDLYFGVRARAADLVSEPWPGFEAAIDAARGLQGPMGSWGGWGPLDSQVFMAPGA